jgi:hypothetical protein
MARMLSIDPETGFFEGFFMGEGRNRMLQFDSDWARVTGLAGGTILTMLFLAVSLFYIAQ